MSDQSMSIVRTRSRARRLYRKLMTYMRSPKCSYTVMFGWRLNHRTRRRAVRRYLRGER